MLLVYRAIPLFRPDAPVSVGPVVFCTTRHFSQLGVKRDEQYHGVSQLAKQFRTIAGESLDGIGVVLLPVRGAELLIQQRIPRMAQDALAFCSVAEGNRLKSGNASFPVASVSDYFETLPIAFARVGFQVISPDHRSIGNNITRYNPIVPAHLAAYDARGFSFDKRLLSAIDRSVNRIVAKPRMPNVFKLRQVFRALAVAFHAAKSLSEPDSDNFDLGTRITHWVSAFETLVHPGRGEGVGPRDVKKLIDSIPWSKNVPKAWLSPHAARERTLISHRRFVYKPKRKGTPRVRENAAAHYYQEIYDLRNRFAHGNALRTNDRRVWGRKSGLRVDVPLPILFRMCVVARLRELGLIPREPTGNTTPTKLKQSLRDRFDLGHFEDALARLLLGSEA